MNAQQLVKVQQLVASTQQDIELMVDAVSAIKTLEATVKSFHKTHKQLSDLLGGISTPPVLAPTVKKEKANYEYEYDGVPDYANRLVLKTTEVLAKRYTFAQHCKEVDQQTIYMNKYGKLTMYAIESEVRGIRKDFERRYFMKNPITSKDGVKFYVTTQWTTTQWDKKKGERVPGTFEKYRIEVSKLGINIKKI